MILIRVVAEKKMLRSNFYDYKINKLSFSLHKILYKIITVKIVSFRNQTNRFLYRKLTEI